MKLSYNSGILLALIVCINACQSGESTAEHEGDSLFQIEQLATEEKEHDDVMTVPDIVVDKQEAVDALIATEFPGFEVLAIEMGDLDNDSDIDRLVVLQEVCDPWDADEPIYCRTLVLITEENDGTFQVAASNADLIDCSECGGGGVGDAYDFIDITEPGTFVVGLVYGGCLRDYITWEFTYDLDRFDWFSTEWKKETIDCNEMSEDGEVQSRVEVNNDEVQFSYAP